VAASVEPFRPGAHRCIVVLTGAGISASAGLPTYRGPGGLWSDAEVRALAETSALATRRDDVRNAWWSMRRATRRVEPSAAHRALAAFEAALPATSRFLVVTQNVDGLHRRAGSRSVVEIHGDLEHWRCEPCAHRFAPEDADEPPGCPRCGRSARPDVVLFGEAPDVDREHEVKKHLRDCDAFVAIGTSGVVLPASSWVRWAVDNGARRVLVDLAPPERVPQFQEVIAGRADDVVPALFPP
jgi:NAD-dependent deacetylase